MTPDQPSFAARPRRVVGLATAAVAFLGVAVLAEETLSVLVAALAAAALTGAALQAALLRPTLVAGVEGLHVRSGLRLISIPWTDLEALRVERVARRLASSTVLAVDTGERLVLLPGGRLGADPDDVRRALLPFRPDLDTD